MTTDTEVKSLKILLVGDSGTGKTSLLSRLVRNEFNLNCKPTNAVDNETHDMLVENNKTVKVDIWDLAGSEKYRTLANSLFHDANGILMVYDITKEATFENIAGWLKDIIRLANSKTVVTLVGNKSDLEHHRAVPRMKAQQLATDHGVSFFETSALDSSNVTMAFQWMIHQICTTRNSISGNADDCPFSTCAFISHCMTKVHQVERPFQNLSCNDTQQQRPFHVVLIDLKKAADDDNPMIHCVEKSLEDANLKYVALSYRWGELQETLIDTHVGYTATIKSFHLNDFYHLCRMMIREVDLKHMEYVWVDAICVDQTNYERRKATIYQMSNIYKHASHILAVPDLHKEHLENTFASNWDIIQGSSRYSRDLYYLIHGKISLLARIEEQLLDKYKVPNDPDLRQLLKASTDHLATGLTEYREHHRFYSAEQSLNHIYEASQAAAATCSSSNSKDTDTEKRPPPPSGKIASLHRHDCHQVDCPLELFSTDVPAWRHINTLVDGEEEHDNRQWRERLQERSAAIRRSMNFMASLIKDWSTRVWVISEYNIAKKKTYMKYWFTQLSSLDLDDEEDLTFFKFDFGSSAHATAIQDAFDRFDMFTDHQYNDPVYVTFHQTMLTQLNEQTFLEMMLNSNASKNEDRFYAIFPQTEYKKIITNKAEVDTWKIDTLVSVKLKMFQVMNTKDKLNLLFLGGNYKLSSLGGILPTFATSSIDWDAYVDYFTSKYMGITQCNFDLGSNDAITFHQSNVLDMPYLNLKPKEYYTVDDDAIALDNANVNGRYDLYANRKIWSRLQSEDPYETNIIVCIPSWDKTVKKVHRKVDWTDYRIIFLNGNFKNNIWILEPRRRHATEGSFFQYWKCHSSDDDSAGFNVY